MKCRAQCWFWWDEQKHAELVKEYNAFQEENFPTQEQYRKKLQDFKKKEAAKKPRAEAAKPAEQLARIPKSKWSKAAIDLHLKTNLDEKAVSQMEGFLAAHGHTASTILDALKDRATGDAAKQYTRAQMQQLVDQVNRERAAVLNAKQQGKAVLTIMEAHQIRIQDEWADTFGFTRSQHLAQYQPPPSQNPPSNIDSQDMATIEGLISVFVSTPGCCVPNP